MTRRKSRIPDGPGLFEVQEQKLTRRIRHKETFIDTQFLDQLFGEGLGNQVKTTSPDAWQLEHKFTVRGVATTDVALGASPYRDTLWIQ